MLSLKLRLLVRVQLLLFMEHARSLVVRLLVVILKKRQEFFVPIGLIARPPVPQTVRLQWLLVMFLIEPGPALFKHAIGKCALVLFKLKHC